MKTPEKIHGRESWKYIKLTYVHKDWIMPSCTLHVINKDKNMDKNDGNTGHVNSMQDALEQCNSDIK